MQPIRATSSEFRTYILRWYQEHGRHHLPWRQDVDPYQILVSEVMLQQTQVDRVIPKFESFMARWPTVASLAAAAPADVIKAWQGLGYNRRGLKLHQAARVIQTQYRGQVPRQLETLLELPGIGPYTAAAIQAFAFNQPSIVIETNIRTVLLYHFGPQLIPDKSGTIGDAQLIPILQDSLDRSQPRIWYSALMDYGATLKKLFPNPSRVSRHHQKQSRFVGSNRQVRGAILKLVSHNSWIERELQQQLATQLSASADKVELAVTALVNEGFLERDGERLGLAKESGNLTLAADPSKDLA